MSVFLALAVGIVVGVSLGSSERQAATIQRLQRDVAAIRAEDTRVKEVNGELRRLLTTREEAEGTLLPLAVRGRLAGNRVAVLLTGDAAVLAAPVVRALKVAGAEVPVTIRLPRETGPSPEPPSGESPPNGRAPAGDEGAGESGPSAKPAESGEVATAVTRAIILGRGDLLASLQARAPELEVSGALTGPVRRLLLICPCDDPEYARRVAAGAGVEAAVGRLAREAQAVLVAADAEAPRLNAITATGDGPPATSLLPAMDALGASTVDNVDTAAGQIAAVLALAGARGSFGTGPQAARPLPDIASP